jgi:asparagine synthase (glutamine-hydrolysing)
MCGISGFISNKNSFSEDEIIKISRSMSQALSHRGPDNFGNWISLEDGVSMSHQRLSILDLSSAGSQPMFSKSGRYVIVFNGEIYNHFKLREKIDVHWTSTSDTETLLESIEQFGLLKTLEMCIGMFAFALWDLKNKTLSLVRDRMGEKPLYYGKQANTFLFSSELKAFKKHPDFKNEINREALVQYFNKGYVPAPFSIWNGINKLTPGTCITVSLSDLNSNREIPDPIAYWSLNKVVKNGQKNPFLGTASQAVDEFEYLLRDSISLQMIADVPVGAFLSGGIDSTTIVALMQAQSKSPIKSFTIGFSESDYNEANYANKIAQYLNTDHEELYVSSKDAQNVIPLITDIYDEPFADSSSIPTFLVSKLAKSKVTVSLSGDGGDELMAGYGRYFDYKAQMLWKRINQMPNNIKPFLFKLFNFKLFELIDLVIKFIGFKNVKSIEVRATLIAKLINSNNYDEFYEIISSQWYPAPLLDCNIFKSDLKLMNDLVLNDIEKMMFRDALDYLPNDILTKVDRSAMSVSLETRVPMLDHRLVEFAWTLPLNIKVYNNTSKWVLKEILAKHIPVELINRPKMGFGVPIDHWLRGPLKEWANDLLSVNKINQGGILNSSIVQKYWNQHLNGQYNWRDSLWTVLMFQSWFEKNKN